MLRPVDIVGFSWFVSVQGKARLAANGWKHVDALFSRVSLFVATHFREEEEFMHKHEHPGYPGHKLQHDKFVNDLAKIQSQINN